MGSARRRFVGGGRVPRPFVLNPQRGRERKSLIELALSHGPHDTYAVFLLRLVSYSTLAQNLWRFDLVTRFRLLEGYCKD